MKIQINQLDSHIKKNLSVLPAILLHGSNQTEIKLTGKRVTELICGPNGLEEMRTNSLDEHTILKDPQSFQTEIKTIGFFPGKQVCIIENTTNKIYKTLIEILNGWTDEDTIIILTAGPLKANSSLRKLIEGHPTAISVALYETQKSFDRFSDILSSSKLKIVDENVIRFLKNPNNFYSTVSFQSFIERLEFYKLTDTQPVDFEDVALLLEDSNNSSKLEMINYLANGDVKNMIVSLKQLLQIGINPTQIISVTKYHFNLLHKISLEPQKSESILNDTYPPIFGSRRKQITNHSRIWCAKRTEQALKIFYLTEKQMRSSTQININLILERSCLNVAYLVNRNLTAPG